MVYVGYANKEDASQSRSGSSPFARLVSGGSIKGEIAVSNRSRLDMTGGQCENIGLQDQSVARIYGGEISVILSAHDASRAEIGGGHISIVDALETSVVNIRAGHIGDMVVKHHSTVSLRGGQVKGVICVADNGTLNVFGTGLRARLVARHVCPPNYPDQDTRYALSGRLADGTNLRGRFLFVQENSRARFALHNAPFQGPQARLRRPLSTRRSH